MLKKGNNIKMKRIIYFLGNPYVDIVIMFVAIGIDTGFLVFDKDFSFTDWYLVFTTIMLAIMLLIPVVRWFIDLDLDKLIQVKSYKILDYSTETLDDGTETYSLRVDINGNIKTLKRNSLKIVVNEQETEYIVDKAKTDTGIVEHSGEYVEKSLDENILNYKRNYFEVMREWNDTYRDKLNIKPKEYVYSYTKTVSITRKNLV